MLYIHIPYCRKKCIYCDFFSGGAKTADWELLTTALLTELESRMNELPEYIDSIYFGGGTPSMMPPQEFERLMTGLRTILHKFGRKISTDVEVTIEINPEDVDTKRIHSWKRGGVNRVSLGIQTFSDDLLKLIGRTHSGLQAEKALCLLMENFDNVSGDIIFGLPGQTVKDLNSDIDRISGLRPQHISVYSLMYEEGTALTALRNKGRLQETDENIVNRQYLELSEKLRGEGYNHYEISNYALPGYKSRHNSGYWTGKPYLGLGPSAHSFDGKDTRRANKPDLFGYLDRFSNHEGEIFYIEEKLNKEDLLVERLMLSLRTSVGLNIKKLEEDFGEPVTQRVKSASRDYITKGQMKITDGYLTLTDSGIMISDTIILELMQ